MNAEERRVWVEEAAARLRPLTAEQRAVVRRILGPHYRRVLEEKSARAESGDKPEPETTGSRT